VYNASDIEVLVNNVQQDPYEAYTVNGTTTLTFTEAPSSGTGNIIVTYRNYTISKFVPGENTVTASSIVDGTITGAKITSNTITGDKIAVSQITSNLIAANAITTAAIADGSINTSELAAGAVTGDKIGLTAITSNLIAANAITTAAIADGSINTSELAAGAVTGDKIGLTAINANNIVSGTITGAKIASATITGDKIGLTAITGNLIASGVTLTSPVIASANLITSLTLAGAAGTNGQVLTSAGSGLPSWTTPSAGALVFLQSVNGTNASSWDFSSVFSSTYDQYMVHVQILTTSLTTRLDWRVKRSGSFVTSDYDQYVAYAASTTLNFLNNSSQPYGTNAYTTNSGLLSMQLMISNVNSTARRFVVIGHGLDVNFVTISGSTQNTLATSQGIAFYLDGGNTVGTGNIKIYGLTNS
jgi:hypothetical protein